MTVPSPPRPWWRHPLLIVAVLATGIVPLLMPGMPPLTDLPGHVARWHIATAGPDSPLTHYYAIHWAWIGNLGTDLLALPLLHVVGPVSTARLIVALIVLIHMSGMLWLSREAHGRIAPTAYFALPLALGWPLQMGFVNFSLSQGMAFAALALWLRLDRRTTLRAALFMPLGLILWTVHSAGWGLFGLMAFGAELARLRGEGRTWTKAVVGAVIACLPLVLPLIVMIAGRSSDPRASESGDWFNLPAKMLWVVSTLRDRWQWFDLASIGVLAFILYLGFREKRLGLTARLLWPAGFCLLAFLLLPRLMLGGSYVDMRMVPAVWALALLAIRPPEDALFAKRLAIAGLAFLAVRMAGTTLSFDLQRAEQRSELGALAHIPRGSAVLAFSYKPCDRTWSDGRIDHLPAHAIIERDAFTNEQWAIPGQQYLRVRYARAMPYIADPSQHAYPSHCRRNGVDLAEAIRSFPRAAFDHVWIINYRLPEPRRFGLETVWSNGRSALYEVIGTTVPGRVERRP